MSEPVLVYDLRSELAEGPLWSLRRQRLLFVEINRGSVHDFDPVTGRDTEVQVPGTVGAIAETVDGSLILATNLGFSRLDPQGRLTSLVDAAPREADVRMNDGYVDARGRFWAGTMSLIGATGAGALYRLDADHTVHEMLGRVTTSNGIDWSPDGTRMYYADTRTGRVDVFDFDLERGTMSNRRPFASIEPDEGRPDGVVVDASGGVWVALWAGGAIRRYGNDGVLDREIRLPAKNVTKCAFGGADLEDLYVTTAWKGMTEAERAAQPHAGGIFRVHPGVRGKSAHLFRG